MKWLGIHGAAGSGKDTVADYIVKTFGGGKVALADPMKHFCRKIFGFNEVQLWGPSENRNKPDPRYAGPLRAATCVVARTRYKEHSADWLKRVLPSTFTPEQHARADAALYMWFDDVLRQTEITPRYALQTLGTEWGRAQHEDMWLLYADREITQLSGRGYAVIPDCRFLNEAAFLTTKQGLLIEIVRPGSDGADAMAAGVAAHASEMERVRLKGEFRKHITHTITNDTTLEDLYTKVAAVVEEAPRGKEGLQRA